MATPKASAGMSSLARYFAETAYLEAAAVDAFRILRDELEAHGAPQALVTGAERAATDEVRHTRIHAQARAPLRRDADAAARAEASRSSPIFAIALENAVEGCVRETFAALVAHHQAAAAGSPHVRAAMGGDCAR